MKTTKNLFKELYNRIPLWKRISLSEIYQNPKWHPEIWVHKHIKQVFNNVCIFFGGDIDLLIAAIFHDITKDENIQRKVMPIKKGKTTQMDMFYFKISNINHETTALKYINKWNHLYNDLKVNWKKVEYVCRNHLLAHLYVNGQLKKRHKRLKFESHRYFWDTIKFEICDSYNHLKKNNNKIREFTMQNGDSYTISNGNIIKNMKIKETTAGLGYEQMAYLLQLSDTTNTMNETQFLCIATKNITGDDLYKVGELVWLYKDEVNDTKFTIEQSPMYNKYLFKYLKTLYNGKTHI